MYIFELLSLCIYIYIMMRQSAAGFPISEVSNNNCVACHFCENKYFVSTIGYHLRYCEACISHFLGDDETKKVEEVKNKRDEHTTDYQHINHGNQPRRLRGYKK